MDGTKPQNATPPLEEGTPIGQVTRTVYLAVGWVCVFLGAAGLVLPVLPGTPLLIVALWAFSRSSRRFHAWLLNHPRLGAPLRAWHRHRTIPVRVKCIALAAMSCSLTYLVFGRDTPWAVSAVVAAIMIAGAVYIMRCPSRP